MKKLALVFPGQGSQSLGMLGDIAREFSEVQAVFNEASDALGYDLWQLTQQGPAEALDNTVHTQPALLTASYALWQILKKTKHIQPAILAGHSLGEYSALVCAESISLATGVKLVAARGQFMQEAVPVGQGVLAAIIGLDDKKVQEICTLSEKEGTVSPANFNCPGQVVIAGQTKAVETAITLAKEAGAKIAKLLPVSVPSHCSLMQPAAEKLTKLLATVSIKKPSIPILNNVDVAIYEDAESIRSGLTRQLIMPVRWVEIIQSFSAQGIERIIECGPGKVLTGLNKRIVANISLSQTADLASLQTLLETSLETE